jgi:hypothetical protein
VVVDTDGSIRWSLVYPTKREAEPFTRHPMRRVVRLVVVEPKPRKRTVRRARGGA